MYMISKLFRYKVWFRQISVLQTYAITLKKMLFCTWAVTAVLHLAAGNEEF